MGLAKDSAPSVGRHVRYRRVETKGDRGWTDAQFDKPKSRVPYKAIAYAIALCLLGTVLLVIGTCLYIGVIWAHDPERWLSLIVLGALTFIPGSYHVVIAYRAWRGDHGYSFDDIPSGWDENLDTTLGLTPTPVPEPERR
eukprot:m.13244 g.13244  ORF g.13244 m.13244 type:complete len:140 (-) comp3023_c0_seq1:162-581(-)